MISPGKISSAAIGAVQGLLRRLGLSKGAGTGAGQVLLLDSNGEIPSGVGGGGGGGRVLISSQTVTAGATLDLDGVLSDTYRWYEVVVFMAPATDNVEAQMRLGTSETYDSDAAAYGWNNFRAGTDQNFDVSDSQITLSGEDSGAKVGNAAGEGLHVRMTIFRPKSTDGDYDALVEFNGHFLNNSGQTNPIVGGAHYLDQEARPTDIRFLFDSGNVAFGVANIYGLADS